MRSEDIMCQSTQGTIAERKEQLANIGQAASSCCENSFWSDIEALRKQAECRRALALGGRESARAIDIDSFTGITRRKESLNFHATRQYLRLLSSCCSIALLASAVEAAPLRVAYSAISGAMSSLWVAQEGGYFKREGLDVELLYIGGGSLLIQSMLSGDVPFAYGPSVPVINASLRGADLVLVGNTGNSLVFSIMSRPEIKQPANLKGKKVGVTRLGGSTDWALDAALKQWGLERREITVIQTGGMPEGLAGFDGRRLRCCGPLAAEQFQSGESRHARTGRCRPIENRFPQHAALDDTIVHQSEPGYRIALYARFQPRSQSAAQLIKSSV